MGGRVEWGKNRAFNYVLVKLLREEIYNFPNLRVIHVPVKLKSTTKQIRSEFKPNEIFEKV